MKSTITREEFNAIVDATRKAHMKAQANENIGALAVVSLHIKACQPVRLKQMNAHTITR